MGFVVLDQLSTKHSTKIRPTQTPQKPELCYIRYYVRVIVPVPHVAPVKPSGRDIFACEENRFASVYNYWIFELFNSVVCLLFILSHNRIGGVMVSVLTSSVVDRVVKTMTAKLVFGSSPLSTQH